MNLLKDGTWLEKFCTYKHLRSILHQMESHRDTTFIELAIEADTEQKFVTVR